MSEPIKERPALELTIYPLCTDPECVAADDTEHYAEPLGMFAWYADEKAAEKRLTGPEMAAENYRQAVRACAESGIAFADGEPDCHEILILSGDLATYGPIRLETSRALDVYRIASAPHAAEADYE